MNSHLELSVGTDYKGRDLEFEGICDTTLYDAQSDSLYDVAPRVDTIRELDWKANLCSMFKCDMLPYMASHAYTFVGFGNDRGRYLTSAAKNVLQFESDSKLFTKEAFAKRLALMAPYLKTMMHPADIDKLFINMYQLNLASIRFDSVFDDACMQFVRVGGDATDADIDAKVLAVRKMLPASRKTLLWHLVKEDDSSTYTRANGIYFYFTGSQVEDNTLLMNVEAGYGIHISDSINKNGVVLAKDVSKCLSRFSAVRELLQSALGEDVNIKIGDVVYTVYPCFSTDKDSLEGSIRPDIGISGTTEDIDTLKTLATELGLELNNPTYIFEEDDAQEIDATRQMYALFGDDSATSSYYGALMYTAWCASQRYISKKWRGWSSARDWQRLTDAKDLVAELKKVDIYGAYTSQLGQNILITSGGFVSVTLDENNNIVGAERMPLSSVCQERGWSEDDFHNMLFNVPRNLAAWAKSNGLHPGITDDLIRNKTSWAYGTGVVYKNFDSLTRMTGRAQLAYSMLTRAYNWWLYKEGQTIWSNIYEYTEKEYDAQTKTFSFVPTERKKLPGIFAVSDDGIGTNMPNGILSKRMNRVTPDSFYGTPYSWKDVPTVFQNVYLVFGTDNRFHFSSSSDKLNGCNVFSTLLEIMSAMDELTMNGTPLDIKSLKLRISDDDFVAIIAEPSSYEDKHSWNQKGNPNFKERFEMPGLIERLCKKFPEEYREKYKIKLEGRESVTCD